jgi:uncharacterized membrane protein YkvA (DUF1232 family)
MADQNDLPGRGADAPRRSVLDDDDDLVGPRRLAAPSLRRKGGGAGRERDNVTSLLRDVPHFVKLLYRLARDPRVSRLDKALVVGALAYAAVPEDAIPDFIPFAGQVDDVLVIGVALGRLVKNAGTELLLEHWEGDEASLESALAVLERGSSILPAPVRALFGAGAR